MIFQFLFLAILVKMEKKFKFEDWVTLRKQRMFRVTRKLEVPISMCREVVTVTVIKPSTPYNSKIHNDGNYAQFRLIIIFNIVVNQSKLTINFNKRRLRWLHGF